MAHNKDNSIEQSMHASGDGVSLKVPGCGLPIMHEPDQDKRFRHGADDHGTFERMTVREESMLALMETLTDKPNWSTKIFNKDIIKKWQEEALSMPWITEKTWDWCLRELQDKAKMYEATKMTTVLDVGSRCVKADNLVPNDLQHALKSAVLPLLDQSPKDWHPGSDEKVLNLVHPSLYPAIYDKTRVLRHKQIPLDQSLAPHDDSVLLVAPVPEKTGEADMRRFNGRGNDTVWSTKFQWLPSDVSFTNDPEKPIRIESYINNLHPDKYRSLYPIIESLISLSIPAWNEVLVDDYGGRTPCRINCNGADTDPPEAPDMGEDQLTSVTEQEAEVIKSKIREYLALPDNPDNGPFDENEEEANEEDEYYWASEIEYKWKRIRKTIHPEPGVSPCVSYDDWKGGKIHENPNALLFEYKDIDIRKTFADTGLQVIVKLASIELTPDKPSYDGGSWHLEGMVNEHIAATSIYYYDVENITESRIRFRQEAILDSVEMSYAQDDHEPLCQVYGVDSLRDEPAIQEIGSIATPHGRLLAFPNTLQHKVEPFELADPTKPGHRRFLVLWLVDPNYRILSTGNVPPQQHGWWAEKARQSTQGRVAVEIQNMIEDQLKDAGTMTLEEAKKYRLELMAERTTFADSVQRNIPTYNFCEH